MATTTFTIDDVRDAFTQDVTTTLSALEGAVRDVLFAPGLEPIVEDLEAPTPYDRVGDQFHAIVGTSSLVAATSLTETARRLEALGRRGADELRAMELHAGRARRIGELCLEGVTALRAMLALELAARNAEAVVLARRFAPDITALELSLDEAPPPGPGTTAAERAAPAAPDEPDAADGGPDAGAAAEPEEYAFDDLADADAARPSGTEAEIELHQIFREEAAAAITELAGHLRALRQTPDDDATLERAERIFHTLKGAAATVGLAGVSAIAAALQLRVDSLRRAGLNPTAQQLDELIYSSRELARTAEVSDADLPDFESTSSVRIMRRAFLVEATEVCADVARVIDQIATQPEARATQREVVTELLARLQGSAALVGERGIAEIAAELAATWTSDPPDLHAAMDDGLHRIAAIAGPALAEIARGGPPPPATDADVDAPSLALDHDWDVDTSLPTPLPVVADEGSEIEFAFHDDSVAHRALASVPAELVEIFRDEASEELARLGGLLEAAERTADRRITDQIERIFHTIKGAAATVGLAAVAAIAADVQETLEDISSGDGELTAPMLGEIVHATLRIVRAAELPEPPDLRRVLDRGPGAPARRPDEQVTLVRPPAAPEPVPTAALVSGDAEARRFFVLEAQQICAEILYLIPRMAAAPPDAARDIQRSIGRQLHRLKGSALIVGDQRIAGDALRLQAIADSDAAGPPLQAALTHGIVRVAQIAGVALPAQAAIPEPVVTSGRRELVNVAVDPRLWESFLQECSELLEQIDKLVLDVERSARPRDVIQSLFGHYHTLKGAINTLGITPTGRALHRVEDYLESLLETPTLPSMRTLATFLLDVQTEVRRNLDSAPAGHVDVGRLEARLEAVLGAEGAAHDAPSRQSGSSRNLFADLGDASAGSASRGSALTGSAGSAGSVGSAGSRGDRMEALERRTLRVPTERLDAMMNLAGELVVSRSRLLSRVGNLRALQGELERNRRRLVDTVDRFREQHEFTQPTQAGGDGDGDAGPSPGAPARRGGNGGGKRNGHGAGDSAADGALAGHRTRRAANAAGLRSDAWTQFSEFELDRYDDINLLARTLAEVSADVSEVDGQLFRELASFVDDSDTLGATVSGIQGEVTRARMVPLEAMFTRLRLPVRDVAEREGKEVRVVTIGEDVNLDKTIVDAMFAPMLHLVRNAVTHGIETPSAREAAHKPHEGVVTLSARQEAGQIVIEVRDDGHGLDLGALRARGVAAGLIPADTPVTAPAIRELVFAHGVSTRDVAHDVAGRGVGGDVVKRAIERLNGDIRVDTQTGAGTTFTITMPVTLAITRAVLVRHRGQRYAVPLYFTERIFDGREVEAVESAGLRRIPYGDDIVALRALDELFGAERGDRAAAPDLVMLRIGDQAMALEVDEVLGQEEVVVKQLGEILAGHPLFSGMTVRGAGELVLILDVPGLLEVGLAHGRPSAGASATAATTALAPAITVVEAPRLGTGGSAPAPGVCALWVDDSLSVRRVAEKQMRALGVDITVAVDGMDALEKLRHRHFDIVFTDLEMPRLHGYELIRELRYLPAYQHLPIVVVSSRSGQKHQRQAQDAGANDYLIKPFSEDVLGAALTRWTGGRFIPPRRGS